jgi:Fe2+ transport system protein B
MSLETKDIMGTMYENFVTRDVTYAGAGALMIISIYHVFFCCVNALTIEILAKPLAFLIFIAVSYFSGLIVKEGICQILGIKYGYPRNFPESRHLEFHAFINEKYGRDGLKRMERTNYFMHVGISFGLGSLVGFLAFLYRGIRTGQKDTYIVFVIFFIVCFFCFVIYQAKRKEYGQVVKEFCRLRPEHKDP